MYFNQPQPHSSQMAINFGHSNSISATGLGLGNGTIDARFFPSPVDSSLGLVGHRIHVHSVIDYVPLPWPAFHPLGDVTAVTQLLTANQFLSPNSTMGLAFVSNSGLGSNRGIFPTRRDHNRFMNMNLLRSVNPSMNRINVRSDIQREARGLGYDGRTQSLPGYLQGVNMNLLGSVNPSTNRTDVRSDFETETRGSGYDGRTHCLPGYPQGVYRCSKCFATFYSSQTFAAHVKCAHYRREGEEERRRRMAARCRRNLRPPQTEHGLTAVPVSSIAKVYAARRRNGVAVGVDNGNEVRIGVGAAMRAPLLSVVVKEEPM
ncbi:hypothetical protein V6N13_065026 [Hibiscus sabdariffa]|uniref:C2H2-type domain-containing protein n=1 Tax=Hibiscus sabdariffa TaxID=183260 RepID=A0ABR2QS25_9ROSI